MSAPLSQTWLTGSGSTAWCIHTCILTRYSHMYSHQVFMTTFREPLWSSHKKCVCMWQRWTIRRRPQDKHTESTPSTQRAKNDELTKVMAGIFQHLFKKKKKFVIFLFFVSFLFHWYLRESFNNFPFQSHLKQLWCGHHPRSLLTLSWLGAFWK